MTPSRPEIDRQAIELEFDAMMAAAPMPPVPDLQQMQEEENSAVAAARAALEAAAQIGEADA